MPLAGVKEVAVIHPAAEQIDVKNTYDQYRHQDTIKVQSDKNTDNLNKATENQPELSTDD